MLLTYRYRLLPTKEQHRALEAILESQRQLYNAALEERTDAYRKGKVTRTLLRIVLDVALESPKTLVIGNMTVQTADCRSTVT